MQSKALGELAELKFCARARELGVQISIPYGDTAKYDFIIDSSGNLLRVQVKSTQWLEEMRGGTRYTITAGHGRRNTMYTLEECDLIVMFIEPMNTWYIVPTSALTSRKVGIYPHKQESGGHYEQYREAWHLLTPKSG